MSKLQYAILGALAGAFWIHQVKIRQLEYEKIVLQKTIDNQWQKLRDVNSKIKQDTSHIKCFRIK